MKPIKKYKCIKEIKNKYANFTYVVGKEYPGKEHVNGRKSGHIIYDGLGFDREYSWIFYTTKDMQDYFVEI